MRRGDLARTIVSKQIQAARWNLWTLLLNRCSRLPGPDMCHRILLLLCAFVHDSRSSLRRLERLPEKPGRGLQPPAQSASLSSRPGLCRFLRPRIVPRIRVVLFPSGTRTWLQSFSFLSPKEEPQTERSGQPDRHEDKGCHHSGRLVAHQNPTNSCCIDKKSKGSEHHGACLHGGIHLSVVAYRDADRCQSDGRRCPEQTGKTLWAKNISEQGEHTYYNSTYYETKNDLIHA
jgi:hypothetical protein